MQTRRGACKCRLSGLKQDLPSLEGKLVKGVKPKNGGDFRLSSKHRSLMTRHSRGKPDSNRRIVTFALMLGMFLAAVEGTIVATAMPSIVTALGGFSQYSWVFSIYLLTEAITIPIYGKFADLFGRKPVFIFGTAIFLIGTALCGLSNTMLQLIVFRGLQGLGSGAIIPLASTIIGDLYRIEERPRVQGAMSSVWAVASVIGPALGGLIVTHLDWHWIFYINIPFGVAAITLLAWFFHEDVQRADSRPPIDYAGTFLLIAGVGALILMLVQGGTAWSWTSLPITLLAIITVTALTLFVLHERRAAEPLLPLDLLRDRTILFCNLGSFLGGGLIFGLTSFIPTFAQGVLGVGAFQAGALLTLMSIGWPLASNLTGLAWRRIGHRGTAMLGTFFTFLSGCILAAMDPNSPAWLLGVGSFIMGMGLGFSQTTYIVTVQSRVAWNRRGVATSSNMFNRILGSTVWVALLGGILNQRLQRALAHLPDLRGTGVPANAGLDVVNLLLDPGTRETISPPLLAQLQAALAHGIHGVFVAVFVTGAAAFVLTYNLPRRALIGNAMESNR